MLYKSTFYFYFLFKYWRWNLNVNGNKFPQTLCFKPTKLLSSVQFSSVQSLSRVRLFVTPASCQASLSEFTQTRVHRVSDAIQPSHPRSSPSSPAPNPSQHQSLFQWVNSSHEVAKVLELQLQHHSFQRNPRVDLLQNRLVGAPLTVL